MLLHEHVHTQTHIHIHTQTHIHMYKHRHRHRHTHRDTHTHTRTCTYVLHICKYVEKRTQTCTQNTYMYITKHTCIIIPNN